MSQHELHPLSHARGEIIASRLDITHFLSQLPKQFLWQLKHTSFAGNQVLGNLLHMRASWKGNIIASDRVRSSRQHPPVLVTSPATQAIISRTGCLHHLIISVFGSVIAPRGSTFHLLVHNSAYSATAVICCWNMEKIYNDLLYHATLLAHCRNDPRAHRLLSEGLRYLDTSPSDQNREQLRDFYSSTPPRVRNKRRINTCN